MEVLGHNEEHDMDDLKHLREVLTEAYPREELSLDALARVVVALEGLPSAALDGGWTFKGFTAWAQGLEEEIAMLKANIDSSPSLDEWNVLRATQCDCTTKIAADGAQVTFCSSAQMARARAMTQLTVRAASDGWGAADAEGNNVGGGCSLEGWLRAVRWTERQHKIGVCAKCGLPPGCPDCRAVHHVGIGAQPLR
jgi:hypothetical protein